MKKVILGLSFIMIFGVSAYAGFWSSVAGGMVANSLSRSSQNGGYTEDAKSDEKKIQQSLAKLGYYDSKLDGNLNSFETRGAIKEFQKHYFIDENGVLTAQEKEDLLYMHDLFKNYKQIFSNLGKKQEDNKLNKVYKAFDDLEDKIRNDNASFIQKMKMKISKPIYLSSKLKKDIEAQKKYLNEEKRKQKELIAKAKKWQEKSVFTRYGLFTDEDSKLLWQDSNIKEILWSTAKKTCSNLKIDGDISGWRLPTKDELHHLYKLKELLKNKSGKYWTSVDYNVVDFDNGKDRKVKFYTLYRCVKGFSKSEEKYQQEKIDNLAKADKLDKEKKYKEAFALYLPYANKNNYHAIEQIADYYFRGKGVKKDRVESTKWYQIAVKHPDANYWAFRELALAYTDNKHGVKKDLNKAERLMKQANELALKWSSAAWSDTLSLLNSIKTLNR